MTAEYIAFEGINLAFIATGSIYWVHGDHLGTPQMLTDAAGAVAWSALYSPFGLAEETGALTFNPRFPGQYHDRETGYYYNYFRTYDPTSGRYVESDPIGLRGGWNTYGYVGENPVMRVDPTGLMAHRRGKWIDCGGGCRISIDGNHVGEGRHLHWECKGSKGACGEFGTVSHGQTCDSAPNRVKKCAAKHGFAVSPVPQGNAEQRSCENCQTVAAVAAAGGAAYILSRCLTTLATVAFPVIIVPGPYCAMFPDMCGRGIDVGPLES